MFAEYYPLIDRTNKVAKVFRIQAEGLPQDKVNGGR
jgi:hypothetical protein